VGALRRLSGAAIARPRAALALFAVTILSLAYFGHDLESRLTPTTLLVPGSESARAADLYSQEFGDGITIPVLLEGPPAALDEQGPALVRVLRKQRDFRVLSAWDRGPAGEALRPSKRAGLIIVGVDRPLTNAVEQGLKDVEKVVAQQTSGPVEPHVTGLASIGLGVKDSSLSAVARAEKIAAPLLLLILLFVFRSAVAAAIPALFGGAAVVAGMGGLSLITRFHDIDAIAISLCSMMGLALGVDYSLLLVSRFREELGGATGREAAREAVLRTVATAGRTVLFAGAVLAAGMAVALLVAPGDLLVSATIGVLVAIAVSVLSAVVGMPAALVLIGSHVDRFWIGRRQAGERRSAPVRLAVAALRRPAVPALLVLGALMAGSAPALALRTGPPDVRMLPDSSPVRKDFEAVRDTMGAGWTAPFEVMVRVPDGAITDRKRLAALKRWQDRVARMPGVAGVVGPGAIAERLPAQSETKQLASVGKQLQRGKRDLERLEDGLGDAGAGVRELRAGLGEAADGAGRLEQGGRAAADGAAAVRAGLGRAARGAAQLADGLRRGRDGGGRLARGADRTAAGAARLARELEKTRREVVDGAGRARELPAGLRAGARDLGKLREPAQKTEAELRAALKELDAMTVGKADPRYRAAYTAVATALGAASGKHPLTGKPVAEGYDGLDPALARAEAELGRAATGADDVVAGIDRLTRGLGELAEGARSLQSGTERLARGADELEGGLKRLARGGGELDSGLAALSEGAGKLEDGVGELAGGAARLRGGLSDGSRRSGALETGLEQGERRVGRQGRELVQADVSGLTRSARTSPGLFDSGYFTLAALDGSRGGDRAGAAFAVSLERGGQAGRIMVVPETGPNEPETAALKDHLKAASRDLEKSVGGTAAVGGAASFLDDYDRVTAARFPYLVLGIVLASWLVLVPVFRSLLLPLIAIVLNLLTVGAAFGILALLYQGDGPLADAGFIDAVSSAGIFCVLFGLSIDYQVFLITRMREGWDRTGSTKEAIAHGLEKTAGVVTGAAGIMLAVFAAFSLADVASIQQFGLGLAVAVLIDATVVRLVLLPAAMRACGKWCWWLPAWLERRLPVVHA
jgi:RND superfamily putative drug exporter